jgi:uncharacterized protein YyaL (SSP411 family)
MSNCLAIETSPYLRQHAGNPVDWRPWGPEALAAARAQDKPILLSIGYSACHWCHVMAQESFEDAATAAVMNDLYINIKVDREERPDLDKIYQLAHQALTRRGGGWPLTVFLTPDDHLPFYAGTYFPKEPRYGMPPFVHILQQVRGFWDQRREDVRSQNTALAEFLAGYGGSEIASEALIDAPIHAALAQIKRNFDPQYGGHAGAPKFPHATEMELLLDMDLPEMVELTLTRMAAGGIHDQIGGGFCRYSVDERWEIPHFEKMLYDNALLLPLLARADQAEYAPVIDGIVNWLQREMTAPGSAFFSALDADSEHEEGKFYVWQRDEVRSLLTDEEFAVVEPHYGFDRPPNFEHVAWNPVVATPTQAIAQSLGITSCEAGSQLAAGRAKLFAARSQRVRPGLDDKILTSWNALMITGLARASRALDNSTLSGLAERALDFLHHSYWRNGHLCASAGAALPAYLDDYAFLLEALIESLQCRWHDRDLALAIAVADALLQRFEDRVRGGFFFTAHDHETLIQRPKPWADEAVPSGNGVAARSLLRVGHLLGETRYLHAAERTLRAAYSTMQQMPQGCASLLRALNDFLRPRTHVVIRVAGHAEAAAWKQALRATNPGAADVYLIPSDASTLPGIVSAQTYRSGGVAYLCRGVNCLPPICNPADLGIAFTDPNG